MQGNVNIPDSTITTNLSFRQLVLMNMQQLTNFPYIEKDFDALTDYELLSLVVKYLNDVIANQNEQNDSITRMYESFLALQTYVNNTKDTLEDAFNELDDYVRNYFDNLDVQDEIDNKLDEYLEDGTLEHIIASYLQTQKIYNTHVEMITDADNLVDGLIVQTLGYYNLNDKGGAYYKITDTESLTEYQEDLGNDLYATMIINDSVNVKQFGAYGDGTHDDTLAIQNAINSNAIIINFESNKTYKITADNDDNLKYALIINKDNKTLDLNNSELVVTPNDQTHYKLIRISDVSNVTVKNGKLTGDVDEHTGVTGEFGHGISIAYAKNITLENLYISKCWGDGIDIIRLDAERQNSDGIYIKNCISDDNRRQGMSIEAGSNIIVENSKFINTGKTAYTAPGAGVDIESYLADSIENIIFKNCEFINNKGRQLVQSAPTGVVNNVIIDNCKFDYNLETAGQSSVILSLEKCNNSKLINSNILGYKQVVLNPADDFIFMNNNAEILYMVLANQYRNNSILNIENNNFKTSRTSKTSLGFINNYTNNPITNQNNKLIIKNNSITDKFSGDYVYNYIIKIMQNQGIDEIIIEENDILGGDVPLSIECPAIIKNNILHNHVNYTLITGTNLTSGTSMYLLMQGNTIYSGGSNTNIVRNYNNNNGTYIDNVYYPVSLKGEDNQVYNKTKFNEYTGAGFITSDRNIIYTQE